MEKYKLTGAIVRCICGEEVFVEIGGRQVTCACGAKVRMIREAGDVSFLPWIDIPENTLSERRRAGHVVKHHRPKIIDWTWKTGRTKRKKGKKGHEQ